jgi:hypothetical protein
MKQLFFSWIRNHGLQLKGQKLFLEESIEFFLTSLHFIFVSWSKQKQKRRMQCYQKLLLCPVTKKMNFLPPLCLYLMNTHTFTHTQIHTHTHTHTQTHTSVDTNTASTKPQVKYLRTVFYNMFVKHLDYSSFFYTNNRNYTKICNNSKFRVFILTDTYNL